MKITFYPDSSVRGFVEAAKEYQNIWDSEGDRIISVWENQTGLKFRESFINAVVNNQISISHPLSLRFDLDSDRKKSVLVHELGHRILSGIIKMMRQSSSEEAHKFLFLVLNEVLVELYGEDFSKETIAWDMNLPREEYRNAWDWALKFSAEERKKMFNEIISHGIYDEKMKEILSR